MDKRFLLMIAAVLMLISCGESDLPESHEVADERILALKIDPCEAGPGDSVAMTLLVGGKHMDQAADLPVTWEVGAPGDAYYTQAVVPYHDPLQLDLPLDLPESVYGDDVFVTASITINHRFLSAVKRFRITPEPVRANPVIQGVRAQYRTDGEKYVQDVGAGAVLSVDGSVKYLVLTAQMANLSQGANDTLVYRWYITESSTNDHTLEADDEPSEIEAILGKDGVAAPYRQSVMISLYGEDGDEKFQSGTYQVYLVVRDNAYQSDDDLPDRLGTDYFSFTVKAM